MWFVKALKTINLQKRVNKIVGDLWDVGDIDLVDDAIISNYTSRPEHFTVLGQITNEAVYNAIADRPAAATFGVGQCQIGGTVYVSDGVSWSPLLSGSLTSGEWAKTPSVFRLRLTGTGTVTVDSRDSLDNITAALAVYTITGATDQIEFPYLGDNAVEIRVTLTGTATAEII